MQLGALPFSPAGAGYRIAYHLSETNYCPGCGRSHWLVGRMTAECAYCATALPIRNGRSMGTGVFRKQGKPFVPLAA